MSDPVLWGLVFSESYGLNEATTFKTEEKAVAYSNRCDPKPRVVPLYERKELNSYSPQPNGYLDNEDHPDDGPDRRGIGDW